MKKIITLCIFLCSMFSFSQESSFFENVRLGGTFGFSFGSNSTTLSIAPSAVYDFNEELSIGGSIGYMYNKSKDYSANMYSASIITLYRPIPSMLESFLENYYSLMSIKKLVLLQTIIVTLL